jgi:hypothetical protein
MIRSVTVVPALLLVLALASPAASQNGSLTATADTVSAAAGGIVGFELSFPNGRDKNYILLVSLGDSGFDFGRLFIPLDPDFLLIHSFFGDLGPPVLQSGFRGPIEITRMGAVAYIGFPPGSLQALVGVKLYFAAITFPANFLPDASTNALELRIEL